MSDIKHQFLKLAIARQALKFGEFTLKSGRVSPYFFNAGLFASGGDLYELGQCYAQTLLEQAVEFDMFFGPAYKGIPLATSASMAMYQISKEHNKPVCFNRKEKKTHGEGGNLIGSPLSGKVLIIDDVITAGTAIRESIDIITSHQAEVAGVIVALDRQEKGKRELSAIQEVEQEFGIPVYSIVNLADLAEFIKSDNQLSVFNQKIEDYRQSFGVAV